MDGEFCPFIKKKCAKLACALYTHLTGMNPQTGQPSDSFGCALAFLPMLLIENSQMIRQGTASTDKVANQVNKQRAEFLASLTGPQKDNMLNLKPELLPEPNGKH